MDKRTRTKGGWGKAKPRTRPYPYEFRLKMVRLYLEEGLSGRATTFERYQLVINLQLDFTPDATEPNTIVDKGSAAIKDIPPNMVIIF